MKVPDIIKSCEKRIVFLKDPVKKQYTAFRLVHGASDKCPGLSIDYYAGYLVINQYQGTIRPLIPEIVQQLNSSGFKISGVYLKDRSLNQHGTYGEQSEASVYGLNATSPLLVQEARIQAEVYLGDGISTGIFMDQRNNRSALIDLAKSGNVKSLLNGFAYTSLFTVALGIAVPNLSSVSVDLSKRSIERSRSNFLLNQLNENQHSLVAGDFLDSVRLFQKRGRRFDMIILDPPTMARNKKGKLGFSVKSHAGEMAEQVMQLLNPQGILFFSVNTESLTQKQFENLVMTPLVRQNTACLLPMPGQAEDYPSSPQFPAHLKVIAIQKS
ncbi:MAG: class I SAM-dependent rRNA methyltransferase [Candidatus Cloacimonetes bacterium]|nr:class I SAM-dependent rRNA methyltransferase [Candidatus Cloacimonadota bacterium]